MTTTYVKDPLLLHTDSFFKNEQIIKIIQPILPQFDRLIRTHLIFNMLFLVSIAAESLLLLVFFTNLVRSSFLAIGIALLFLTVFSYIIFRIYFQAAKPEQLLQLKNQFVTNFKTLFHYQEGIPEHHLALAVSCTRLSDMLAGKEDSYYRPPSWLNFLTPSLEKFSVWWHWQDLLKMRELFLKASIEEHIKLIRIEPTNMEFHTALANAYVMLSTLYASQCKQLGASENSWMGRQHYADELEIKFRQISEKAIEELKIINEYSPNDPWIHLQLAYSYHDLNLPLEEIREYENILRINPSDMEALYKLGTLYFQQGMNAKGLKIYEELKRMHHKKADSLLKFYE
jgi:tetratricopeptide (TPR) repeat protein